MNILSIGNSFSQDAQRYLHSIAKADGCDLNTYNLYIGGCPFSLHYRNMLSGNKAYTLEMNGVSTGFRVSLEEALLNRNWDVITLQQASYESNNYDTYQPYVSKLADYVRHCVPRAKLVIHQTWAYEDGSERLCERMGYSCHADMFADIEKSYQKAAADIGADFIIPSGKVFHTLTEQGVKDIHRDTSHASYGLGRYALGLIWYGKITGNDVLNNSFSDFDEEIADDMVLNIKNIVANLCR